MFLPIVAAIFLGAWGLPPSWQPQPAQGVENQPQPTQHNTSAEPSVEKQKGESEQRAGKKEHEQSHVERMLKLVREYNAELVAISTAIMALFTIALFAATFALWFGGERHSNRELRAYLSVRPSLVFNFNRPPIQNICVRCVFFNHGQTPAFHVITTYGIGVFPSNLMEPPHEATVQPPYEASVFPSSNIDFDFWTAVPLTTQQIADVTSGIQSIFVWGIVRYQDAFKKRRWTRFFTSAGGPYFAAAASAIPAKPFQWSYGNRHNEAT